jgi:hypothetical protein
MISVARPRLKKYVQDRVLSSLVSLLAFFIITAASFGAELSAPPHEKSVTPPVLKPLVIYYSRTGTTRTIARELAHNLSCEIEEIISRKERHSIWAITCVFDQLFNRDDDIEPTRRNLANYNPLIIASPVWLHHISSPMRTFLKHTSVQGKDAFLILTNNGNFDEEDKKNIIANSTSYGLSIKRCYPICTSNKDEDALRYETHILLEDILSLLNK